MTAMTEPIGLAEGRPFTVHDHELDEHGRYQLTAKVSGEEGYAAPDHSRCGCAQSDCSMACARTEFTHPYWAR